jgi:hypothetical protein
MSRPKLIIRPSRLMSFGIASAGYQWLYWSYVPAAERLTGPYDSWPRWRLCNRATRAEAAVTGEVARLGTGQGRGMIRRGLSCKSHYLQAMRVCRLSSSRSSSVQAAITLHCGTYGSSPVMGLRVCGRVLKRSLPLACRFRGEAIPLSLFFFFSFFCRLHEAEPRRSAPLPW